MKYFLDMHPTGSAWICPQSTTPPNDYDMVCLTKNLAEVYTLLLKEGYTVKTDQPDYMAMDAVMLSFKKPSGDGKDINLIVTANHGFYLQFVRATKIAKALKLEDKVQRVLLFTGMLMEFLPDESKFREYLNKCEL